MYRICACALALVLLPPAMGQVGRKIVTDDASGFNSASVQATSGVQWTAARTSDVRALPNGDQPVVDVSTSFTLRSGAMVIPGNSAEMVATEDGQLFFGGAPGTPSITPNFISLFRGANLVSGAPYNYRESVGVLSSNGLKGYRLGEFSQASANGLAQRPSGGFNPNANDPTKYGFQKRVTWFGLTDDYDQCSAEQLDLANGMIQGTACDNYARLPRYFGQVELHDVGTKDDGDFDLFIGLGYGGTVYAPDGTQVAGYGNTLGYPSTATGGGFQLGNQAYFFTSAEVNNGTFLSEFHFRNGVACAVQADGSCSGNFTVNGTGGGGNGVPAPGTALLVLAGLLAAARGLRSR